MPEQNFSVLGLTCTHCVQAVTEEIQQIQSVTEVVVDLVVEGTSVVRVHSHDPLNDAQITAALSEAGDYRLLEA